MTIAIRKPSLGSAATTFLAKDHKLLIDGKWVAAKSGETFQVEDPATRRGHRPRSGRRQSRYRRGGRRGPPGLRDRSLVAHLAGRSLAPGLAARRSPRAARRRIRRARSARQRQAGDECAPRRRARLDQHVPLHGRLVDAPQRRNDSGVEPRQLARLHIARAGRRRRPDHPVEFPADDGGLEARAGARRRLHDRAQAGRADAAFGAAFRRAHPGSRIPGRRRQHRHRLRRDGGRRARRASGRRQGGLHRLDRSRQAHRQGGGGQPQARVARAWRQVAGDRLPRRRHRRRHRRNRVRDILQPGPMLHGGLASLRPQIDL